MPFDETNKGIEASFKPIKDKDQIEFYWTLPNYRSEYMSNPLSYFSHLIGHEGENSLLSYLKQSGYAMELCAGGDHELDCFSDFTITITLTKLGLENTDKVYNAVFTYLQKLKAVGPQQWVFDETKKVGKISFDYAEKGDPMGYVVGLARTMPHFNTPESMPHLLRHKYLADEYKPETLTEILNHLAEPKQVIVLLSSQSFSDESLPIHEYWYKFDYKCEKLPEDRLN